MRLGYLITKFPPITGGGESHIELVARQMAMRGHNVEIITAPHSERTSLKFPYIIHEVEGLSDKSVNFDAVAAITSILEASKYDLLYIVNYEALFYFSFAEPPTQFTTKLIFSTYNTPVIGKRIFDGIGKRFDVEKRLIKRAMQEVSIDHFIVNSESFREGFTEIGAPHEKTTRIDFGIDLDIFKPAIAKKPIDTKKEIKLLCTSRFVQRKGIEDLIKSLDYLPLNYHLHLTGSGSVHNQGTHTYLKNLASRYGNRVTLASKKKSLKELVELYRSADIFIMPSEYEGFGLSALEAMACGTPVVATNVQGLREFIHHESTGLLVDYADPKQIAKAIERLVSDTALRNILIDNATYQARDQYNVADMIDKSEDLYKKVVG